MVEPKVCPDCGDTFEGPMAPARLGQHRKSKHGVAGSSPKRAGAKRRDRAPKGADAKPRTPPLKAELRSAFRVIGTMLAVVDPYCGGVLIERTDTLAGALADLAKHDERVNRWLRSLGRAGPYGALVIAAAGVGVPIAAHHGLIAREVALIVGAPEPPARRRHRAGDAGDEDIDDPAVAAMLRAAVLDAEDNGQGAEVAVSDASSP